MVRVKHNPVKSEPQLGGTGWNGTLFLRSQFHEDSMDESEPSSETSGVADTVMTISTSSAPLGDRRNTLWVRLLPVLTFSHSQLCTVLRNDVAAFPALVQ